MRMPRFLRHLFPGGRSPRELLEQQRATAYIQMFTHEQAAETHLALANLNRKRIERIDHRIRQIEDGLDTGPVVSELDAVEMVNAQAYAAS